MRERQKLDEAINGLTSMGTDLTETVELIELGEAEGEEDMADEGVEVLKELSSKARRLQIEALLSGEADGNDTYVEIHSGAGGTESQDWAEMPFRMYARWAEQRGFKVETGEYQAGDQAGIKSATLRIRGDNAYGYGKTESGVHRLVRISPYDSAAKRHTSFSSVWVYPVIDDDIDIEINPADLKIDTYRASGAGGQHVNTTDSAVRITHNPTGIVVQCPNERSQHKNRATAWNMLRARLYELELQKREEKANAEASAKTDIGWATKSAPTCCNLISWSKTCAPAMKAPRPQMCSTASLIALWKPPLLSGPMAGLPRLRIWTRPSRSMQLLGDAG